MFDALSSSVRSWALGLSVSAHIGVAWVAASRPSAAIAGHVEPPTPEWVAPELFWPTSDAKSEPAEPAAQRTGHHRASRRDDVTRQDTSLPPPRLTSRSDARPMPVATAFERAAPLPHFALAVTPATRPSQRAPSLGGGDRAAPARSGDDALAESLADSPATFLTGSAPAYTREAEAAGVEADVPLEVVVDAAGVVADARVLKHVGYGLDEVALQSVRAYRFAPARRHGNPVAIRMRWLMRFQLR